MLQTSLRRLFFVLLACLAGQQVQGEDDWISSRDWHSGGSIAEHAPSTGLQLLDELPQPTYDYVRPSAAEVVFDEVGDPLPETSLLNSREVLSAAFGEPYVADPFQGRPTGWQLLPQGHLYHAYLAGEKESRMASQFLWDRDRGLVWDTALGGRWGLVRNGTYGADNPQGFQLDMEGAGLARVDMGERQDLEAVDFRAGIIGTWRDGPWRWKTGYYHLSSHAGDEYLLRVPTFQRINYVRDAVLVGSVYDVTPDFQLYGEIAVALNHNGGAEPLELQFGAQYSPLAPRGPQGAPFAAINGHLRQEFNMGGSVNMMAGWQWRGAAGEQLFRMGVQHYNGPSMQWELFNQYESMTGMGIWYDF